MDRSNRKLKILCKCIKANTRAIWHHAVHTTSPNCSNKKDRIHTQEPTFHKMEVMGKTDKENGPKAEKDKTEIATGL